MRFMSLSSCSEGRNPCGPLKLASYFASNKIARPAFPAVSSKLGRSFTLLSDCQQDFLFNSAIYLLHKGWAGGLRQGILNIGRRERQAGNKRWGRDA
jgi:hypothetical protein